MAPRTPKKQTAKAVGASILRERSPNLPETIQGRGTPSTGTSSLTNSTSQRNATHAQQTQHQAGVIDRTTLLALAYMPPTPGDDDDDTTRPRDAVLNAEEEVANYELGCLADYRGSSDDEGDEAGDVLLDQSDLQLLRAERTGEELAALVDDGGFVSCEADDDILKQQSQQNAPLLLPGAPPGWKAPAPPTDWKPAKPNTDLGEPSDFSKIDNPGGWSDFTFQPKFQYVKRKKSKYLYHALPTGATPVPEDDDGLRSINGWEFFYQGWTREDSDPLFRSGANRDNLFPEQRKGSLDVNILTQLGLNVERMYDPSDACPDSFFFYQLILPIHDIENGGSGIDGDPRKSFYPDVCRNTELYVISDLKLRGSGRGHHFKETSPQELVKWDGILVMDGVLGGSKGAIARRFDNRNGANKKGF